MNPYLIIIILSVVEGITEFLPVSSTGHMILVERFINSSYFSKTFMDSFLVVVQLGAILAVLIYFWSEITPFIKDKNLLKKRFILYLKLAIAMIPAVIIGLAFEDIISDYFMDNVYIVASTLVFYGILFIVIEKIFKNRDSKIDKIDNLSFVKVFIIGIFQCLAMVPGTSRSGATIIGGLLLGLSKSLAAEFSFLLAIPTMFGATFLKLIKNGIGFTGIEWVFMGIGVTISFIIAYVAIKWFMDYIKRKSFEVFGIYRIILGILVFGIMFISR